MKKETNLNANPSLAGAIFFGLYALALVVFAKLSLPHIPLKFNPNFLPSSWLGIITGLFIGRYFSNQLVKFTSWVKIILFSLLMSVSAMISFSTLILFQAYVYHPELFAQIKIWQDFFVIYLAIFLSLLVIIGPWLIPLTSLAALYFNKQFFPKLNQWNNTR